MRQFFILAICTIFLGSCKSPGSSKNDVPKNQPQADKKDTSGNRIVRVNVDDRGYEPNSIKASPNEVLTLEFFRTTDGECSRYVKIAGKEGQVELPLNTPVAIAVTAPASGTLNFTCGMDMLKGSLLVQ